MTGQLVQLNALTDAQREAMYALLCEHFDGVLRPQFDRDLAEKNWVVLLERAGRLLGFSTIRAYETEVGGETLSVIYSGDTIVAPAAWGAAALPRAWIHAVYELRQHFARGRFIWLLLTSGFRTYRFLPVFWREFYPTPHTSTPREWQTLLTALATQQFGDCFNAASGLVRFEHPQRLRGQLRDVPPSRMHDPYVAFFLQQNPEYVHGDELVCVTDLDPSNLTPAGRRVVSGARR